MIEQYLNPRTPSLQELKRRKRLIKIEQKRRLDEARLVRWEQKYWEQLTVGTSAGAGEGTGAGIGFWEIGDSFIVQ